MDFKTKNIKIKHKGVNFEFKPVTPKTTMQLQEASKLGLDAQCDFYAENLVKADGLTVDGKKVKINNLKDYSLEIFQFISEAFIEGINNSNISNEKTAKKQ